MKLHLGCGTDYLEGFVNIDLHPHDKRFVGHDLRDGLPLSVENVSTIYSSHFIEHLTDSDAVRLLTDCYHSMMSGGRIRLCLPDFEVAAAAYLHGDREFFDILNWDLFSAHSTRSLIDVMSYCVYQGGEHLSIWDKTKAKRVLEHVGFKNVTPSEFTPGVDQDYEVRKRFSFYIEGWR